MTPNGFLFCHVDTNVPGFRSLSAGATDSTVAAGYYDFESYITALNAALYSLGWTCSFSTSTGLVTYTAGGGASNLLFNDRTGHITGMQSKGGDALYAAYGPYVSSVPPPGTLWLQGATWESVNIERERVLETTRHGRGFGYIWGGAKIWRWKLQIHPKSIIPSDSGNFTTEQPLLSSFIAKGKVKLWMGNSNAISETHPGGYLTGHVIGLDSIKRVSAAGYEMYEASLLVCS
mgnify:FL=1|tara:strand:+ start:19984 stop:20682 length:699 start_codon:yes stop_codon:yes gene_type:complete